MPPLGLVDLKADGALFGAPEGGAAGDEVWPAGVGRVGNVGMLLGMTLGALDL